MSVSSKPNLYNTLFVVLATKTILNVVFIHRLITKMIHFLGQRPFAEFKRVICLFFSKDSDGVSLTGEIHLSRF